MTQHLWHDESGLTTVEYALILAVMVLAAFTVGQLIAVHVRGSASHGADSASVPG